MKDGDYALDRRRWTHRLVSLGVYFLVLFLAHQWGGTELLRRCWYFFLIPTGMIWFAESFALETGHRGPDKGWNFFPAHLPGAIRWVGWFLLVGVPATILLFQTAVS